jgi:transposase
VRRYKNPKVNGHERQRYHALILVTKGYSYKEAADILLVDEETISRWVKLYEQKRLEGLKNHPDWGGEHGQRNFNEEELTELEKILQTEAMPCSRVGSGWTAKAIRQVIEERFSLRYGRSGVRKLLHYLEWSYQRGRKLYIKRTLEDQARYELESAEALAEFAVSGERVIPLAGDQSKVYLEASLAKRWNPKAQQPLVPDGARTKAAENIYGALHLGTGEEVASFLIDWQDSDATIRWMEMMLEQYKRGQILLWIDQAPHHRSDEVEEFLEQNPRIRVINFPKYTPEENPKENTWKPLKEEVSNHKWHSSVEDLRKDVISYYRQAKQHTVSFLQKFGYFWRAGRLYPLPESAL